MRQTILYSVLAVILIVIVIPAIIELGFYRDRPIQKVVEESRSKPEVVAAPVKLYIKETGQIINLDLEKYVVGVVAAEMPADFELEALKAQAVAARTFAMKNMPAYGGSGVPGRQDADLSNDYQQGQAWQSEEQLRTKWGQNFNRYFKRITQAVEETKGLIAMYKEAPINASFHSTCGGRTASAKEVWGEAVPYLQSVSCNWDQKSPRYIDQKEYTLLELEVLLGKDAGVMAAVQNGREQVAQIIDRTESGRVNQVRIGTKVLNGTALRSKLALRSCNFTIERNNDKLLFRTVGYGHGAGMCQYGANGMSKEGKGFIDILKYYYFGIEVKRF